MCMEYCNYLYHVMSVQIRGWSHCCCCIPLFSSVAVQRVDDTAKISCHILTKLSMASLRRGSGKTLVQLSNI